MSTGRAVHPYFRFSINPVNHRLGPDTVVPCRAVPLCDDGGSEIARCDGEIDAEVERARDAVAEKGRVLHDERERVQKAALAALDILSGGRGAI